MTCDCDMPQGKSCWASCSLGVVVVSQVEGGGGPINKEAAFAVINQFLESSFDESLDMTLITEAGEKLFGLGYFDAAFTMSLAVTSALTYADARFGDIAGVSQNFLERNYDLQGKIIEAKGSPERAAELRQKFVNFTSKSD